jgi:hypothetical protein
MNESPALSRYLVVWLGERVWMLKMGPKKNVEVENLLKCHYLLPSSAQDLAQLSWAELALILFLQPARNSSEIAANEQNLSANVLVRLL